MSDESDGDISAPQQTRRVALAVEQHRSSPSLSPSSSRSLE